MQRVQEAALCLVACQVQFDATIYHFGVRDEPHVARTRDSQNDADIRRILCTVYVDSHATFDACVLHGLAVNVPRLSADMQATVKLPTAYKTRGLWLGQRTSPNDCQ